MALNLGDENLDQTRKDDSLNESFSNKKSRRSGLSSEELCLISSWYVEHYDVYHNCLSGASKQDAVTAKKKLLERISEDLVMHKFSKRTPEQIDQRIRDTIKKAKEKLNELKKERSKTGGGMASAVEVPAFVQIVLDKSDNKPRLVGIKGGFEVGGVAQQQEVQSDLSMGPELEVDDVPKYRTSVKTEPRLDLSYFSMNPLQDVSQDAAFNSSFLERMPPPTKNSTPVKGFTPRTAIKRPLSTDKDTNTTHEKVKLLKLEQERISGQISKDRKEHELVELKIENEKQMALLLQMKCEYYAKKLEG